MSTNCVLQINFFLIHIMDGGVQTGSTRHVGHFWPVVPAPGDCEDGEFCGMKICRGNRSTQRKPAPASLRPQQTPTWPGPGSNPGHSVGKPATNRLRYGAALPYVLLVQLGSDVMAERTSPFSLSADVRSSFIHFAADSWFLVDNGSQRSYSFRCPVCLSLLLPVGLCRHILIVLKH
jgi:hypothetical protein